MGYISEAKKVTQQYYSGYCKYCRNMNVQPVPYCNFTMELYNAIKIASHSTYGIKKQTL